MPQPVCTSSKISSASNSSHSSRIAAKNSGRKWRSPPSPWIGSAMKQAMSCGCASNAARAWRSDSASSGVHIGAGPEVRRVDARPVELREPRDLVGVGVGQRQRVAAAAVEGAAQVQHLGAEVGVDPARLVEPALPVERHLQRVLDGERAAVDEEQVRQRGIAEHPGERVDEARHRHAVDVGVARLVDRGLREFGAELRVVGQRRMVHAERGRREEREHVQVALAGAGVDEVGARRAFDVEDEVEAVGQDAAAQHVADVVGAGWRRPVRCGVRTAVMPPS